MFNILYPIVPKERINAKITSLYIILVILLLILFDVLLLYKRNKNIIDVTTINTVNITTKSKVATLFTLKIFLI